MLTSHRSLSPYCKPYRYDAELFTGGITRPCNVVYTTLSRKVAAIGKWAYPFPEDNHATAWQFIDGNPILMIRCVLEKPHRHILTNCHCCIHLAKGSPSDGPPAASPPSATTGFGFGFGFGLGRGIPPATSPSPSRRGERDLERAGILEHLCGILSERIITALPQVRLIRSF